MNMATVSIIIPTYNRPVLLERAVRSVLQQTWSAFEIIIIDDGSDADLQASLEQVANLSTKIVLHHLPENRGVSYARNFGLKISQGDYILFLDDDDEIHPNMLATGITTFTDKIDIVTFLCCIKAEYKLKKGDNLIYYLLSHKEFHKFSIKNWLNSFHKNQQRHELENRPFSAILKSCPATNASIIRRSAIGNCQFPEDLTFGEDWYFWLSMAHQGCRFKVNNNVYAYVHRHKLNTTRSVETFYHQIIHCLNRIVESGMLKTREDQFNIRARYVRADQQTLQLIIDRQTLFFILKAPDLTMKLLFFYLCEYL